MMTKQEFKSPIGLLHLVANEQGLCQIIHDSQPANDKSFLKNITFSQDHPELNKTETQLKEYFSGNRQEFDLKLAPVGTDFQKQSWRELQKIPYGSTISYHEQARRLGDSNKCRAVGSANGKNPLPIVIPCHRVVAKDGGLGGFGWGLETKKYLLSLEQNQSKVSQ